MKIVMYWSISVFLGAPIRSYLFLFVFNLFWVGLSGFLATES